MGERGDGPTKGDTTRGQPSVQGRVQVEARPVLWIRCPICGQEHRYPFDASDLLPVTGQRYWRKHCHGQRFYVRVSATQIPKALELAHAIAQQHDLSERWVDR